MKSLSQFKSDQRKSETQILFVPFFGAHRGALQRHVEFVNGLGFDCYAIKLRDSFVPKFDHYFTSDLRFGKKHVWTEQIESALNFIKGPKIVFSFSNPTASAIQAISRRNANDIKALICDGGPAENFVESFENYFLHEMPIKNPLLRTTAAKSISLLWHHRLAHSVHQDLNLIPEGFKILSIRGWQDKLITPEMIDLIFQPHANLDWRKLSLPKAGHLNGLKDFKGDYEPVVADFLKEVQ